MKSRSYKVAVSAYEWNFSGLSSLKDRYITTVHDFVPTVSNVRSLVYKLFPDEQIDERDMTLYEQIHSMFDCGMIDVSLVSHDMFLSRSVSMTEVFRRNTD